MSTYLMDFIVLWSAWPYIVKQCLLGSEYAYNSENR